MDAVVAVEKEIDKVINKFSGIKETSQRSLGELAKYVQSVKNEIDNCQMEEDLDSTQALIVNQTVAKLREAVQRLASDHRDLHSTVSRVGKAIDRNFVADFASTSRDDVFGNDTTSGSPISNSNNSNKLTLLNEVICEHFYRQGMLDIAEQLAVEAAVATAAAGKEPFAELNRIMESLRRRELQPALEWAQARRQPLAAINSTLEFKLHRLHFIGLLREGVKNQSEAVQYARTFFKQFVPRHQTDIQNLMGMLLYLPQGLASSPYHHLLDSTLWSEIYDVFTKDACSLLGLSVESPLSVSINAGCIALPSLLNIKQVMLQRQVTGIWTGKDELPIEINVGPEHRYHSVFACPILRQQSSDSNPPMRLVCGHVISRDALNKLSVGNKLKCPYCPLEQNPADARLVYF